MQELQFLYGVPKEDKKWIKRVMELAALENERKIVQLHSIPPPEFLLFGYQTKAECYGYKQRGEYFIDRQSPDKLMDIVERELESLAPSIDLPPQELHRLRDETMNHVNFAIQWHENYDSVDKIPIQDVAWHLNQLAYHRGRDHQWNLAGVLKGIAYIIEVLPESPLAEVIPLR